MGQHFAAERIDAHPSIGILILQLKLKQSDVIPKVEYTNTSTALFASGESTVLLIRSQPTPYAEVFQIGSCQMSIDIVIRVVIEERVLVCIPCPIDIVSRRILLVLAENEVCRN